MDLSQLHDLHVRRLPSAWFFRPVAIEIEMTHLCNLRCPGCAIIEDVERGLLGLGADRIIDLLRQAAQTSIYAYSLTGGEPFTTLATLCEVLAASPIDLFKIQTNGKIFSSARRTREVLAKLEDAGFLRNKHIPASLNVSFGMQTEAGVPLRNVAHVTHQFIERFGSRARLVLNCATESREQNKKIFATLEAEYHSIAGAPLPYDKLRRVNDFQYLHTPRLETLGLVDGETMSAQQHIEATPLGYRCFNFAVDKVDSPVPRILVRADGGAYACSCFGHAGYVGSIAQAPLLELIERMNRDAGLRAVAQNGLRGLVEHTRTTHPERLHLQVPKKASICNACKVLREGATTAGDAPRSIPAARPA